MLARAAAMQEIGTSTSTSTSSISPDRHGSRKAVKHGCSRPGSPGNNASRKEAKRASEAPQRGPDLPPILLTTPSSSELRVNLPNFETMPPMSMITSLAGSGCTCGLTCACPGCLEHRGPEHASKERKDCVDGCGTCIDHSTGIALPGCDSNKLAGITMPNYLDRFFARAAALPAPPSNRRRGIGVELDPMDVTVYPDVARDAGERGLVFGLVNLPKLECCGGRCGCADTICGCGKTCDGCCEKYGGDEAAEISEIVKVPKELERVSSPGLRSSCCSG